MGDFNRDGKNDLAVAGPNPAAVLLGDGTGRFGAPTSLAIDSAAAVVTADFDRDGNLDLAITRRQRSSGSADGAVRLLRGDGTGRFSTPATVIQLPAGAERLVARDFNQDELLDLAVFIPGLGIALLPSFGTLPLRPPVHYSAGAASGGFGVGDFNRDGKLDLAVQANNPSPASLTSTLGHNALLVLLDNTGVDFVAPRDTVMQLSSLAFATGDFNGDGLPDVVTAGTAEFVVRLATASGGFAIPILPLVQGASGNRFLVRDFNRDGRLDLIAYSTDSVAVWLGDGRGGFQPGPRVSIPQPITQSIQLARSLAVADFNGDGRADFVTLNSARQPALYLNHGTDGFAASAIFGAGQNLRLFFAGDFNGDGKADIAAAVQPFGLCTSGSASVFMFAGDG